MAEQFGQQLQLYCSNDFGTVKSASDALYTLIESLAQAHVDLNAFLSKLETTVSTWNHRRGQVLGLSVVEGWLPLVRLFNYILSAGNTVFQERAFAALVTLLEIAQPAEEGGGERGPIQQIADKLVGLSLVVLDGQKRGAEKSPVEVRAAALHALSTLMSKFPADQLPPGVLNLLPELQSSLLSFLPEHSNESLRELAHKCLAQLVRFHQKPASLFSTLQDMSADCELMLKDDPLLDDLLDKALGRMNELNACHNGKNNG